jgi:hypothetical protein
MDVLEDLRRQTEVLCYDGLGCRILGKVAAVEDQQEFGSVLAQALEGVRVAGWEIPEIALLQVIDEGTTVSVERGNANLAFVKLVVIQLVSLQG